MTDPRLLSDADIKLVETLRRSDDLTMQVMRGYYAQREIIAAITAERDDLIDTVHACLLAAGGSEDIDELEKQSRAAGQNPSDFVRARIEAITAERDALKTENRIVTLGMYCGECGVAYSPDSANGKCPEAHRETWPHQWVNQQSRDIQKRLIDATAERDRLRVDRNVALAHIRLADSALVRAGIPMADTYGTLLSVEEGVEMLAADRDRLRAEKSEADNRYKELIGAAKQAYGALVGTSARDDSVCGQAKLRLRPFVLSALEAAKGTGDGK